MMKTVFLTDVAELENRPQAGKVYPVGTIIIQISATRGQVLYLIQETKIENHYAVIQPKKIHSFYLFEVIKKFFPPFFNARKQGLNFKAEELKAFQFPIHCDEKKQRLIGKTLMICGGDCGEFYRYDE